MKYLLYHRNFIHPIQANNNIRDMCNFIPKPFYTLLVLNPATTAMGIVSGTVLVTSGAKTSQAIMIEGQVFIFVGTTNYIEKVYLLKLFGCDAA